MPATRPSCGTALSRRASLFLVLAAAFGAVCGVAAEQPRSGGTSSGEAERREQERAEDGEPVRPIFGTRSARMRRWGSVLLRGPFDKERKRPSEETVTGLVHFTAGKSLVLQDPKAQRVVRINPAKVASIDVAVEKESLEKEWRWREQGSDEKVLTGKTYPDRTYVFTVKLLDGKELTGRFLGFPVYVKPEGARTRKLVVRPRQRGKPGERPADIVHVAGIAFHEKGTPPPWSVRDKEEEERVPGAKAGKGSAGGKSGVGKEGAEERHSGPGRAEDKGEDF